MSSTAGQASSGTRFKHAMKKQAGYTLVEMCIVIAILSMILTVAAGVVHGLLRVNHATREGLAEQAALGRLAETFRADVRAADEFLATPTAEDASSSKQWELKQTSAATVHYRLGENRLTRTVKTPAGPTCESFDLPRGASVVIQQQRQGEATLVTLIVTPGQTAAEGPARSTAGLRVEAQLARDRRLALTPLEAPKTEATTAPREEPSDE